VGILEDPNEGSLGPHGKKNMRQYHSDAKEGKCDSETISSVETLFIE